MYLGIVVGVVRVGRPRRERRNQRHVLRVPAFDKIEGVLDTVEGVLDSRERVAAHVASAAISVMFCERPPLSCHMKCFPSRFADVNSPTNPSIYPSLLLI